MKNQSDQPKIVIDSLRIQAALAESDKERQSAAARRPTNPSGYKEPKVEFQKRVFRPPWFVVGDCHGLTYN